MKLSFHIAAFAVGISVLGGSSARAASATNEYWMWGERPMPDGLKITLVSDKAVWFLGETLLLHYRIENFGEAPVEASVGGDYRGANRADRFKVTATDADGKKVPDPTPVQINFGGLSPTGEIKPGTDWYERVLLQEYCRFDRPGRYTVKVFHDLGFGKPREHDPRETTTIIDLREPTVEQARAILDAAERHPENGASWGKKGVAALDYQCIRHPAFLTPLLERARQTNANALAGIGSIRTVAATGALVELLAHTNAAFAAQVAMQLEHRLPHPATDKVGAWAKVRQQGWAEEAWSDRLAPAVRDFAVLRLATGKRDDVLLAASLLRCVGTARQVPAMLAALDRAVAATEGAYAGDLGYPQPVSASDRLAEAIVLASRGGKLPHDLNSAGHALLYVLQSDRPENPLTRGEESTWAKLLKHPLAILRARALEHLPNTVPPSLAPVVTERMTDKNIAVQNFAFLVAQRMNDPRHRDIALGVFQEARDEWLCRAAQTVALKYHARYECARIWVTHLVVPHDINDYTIHRGLTELFSLLSGHSSGGGGFFGTMDESAAAALRGRWEKFLETNREQVASGTLFQPGDGRMPKELVPPGWSLN